MIEELLVDVGDPVAAGQLLARLDSHRREVADEASARATLNLAEMNLAKVLAGAKTGDIVAQQALVEQTQSRQALAKKKLDRAEKLAISKAISADDLDMARTELETEERALRQHEATLAALKEIRSVDVDYAQAQIAQAKAALQRAEADVAVTTINSPIDGVILRINTRVKELARMACWNLAILQKWTWSRKFTRQTSFVCDSANSRQSNFATGVRRCMGM